MIPDITAFMSGSIKWIYDKELKCLEANNDNTFVYLDIETYNDMSKEITSYDARYLLNNEIDDALFDMVGNE